MGLYTAIGIKRQDNQGRFQIEADKNTYVLSGIEPFLWSALSWAFVEEETVFERMQYLIDTAHVQKDISESEFSYCLRRLRTRNLVAYMDGNEREETIFAILSRSIVFPEGPSAADRADAFWFAIQNRYGLLKAMRAFHKVRLNAKEQDVYARLKESGDIAGHVLAMCEEEAHDFLHAVASLYEQKMLSISVVKGV